MKLLSVVLVLLLAGCVTATSHILTGSARPAISPEQVKIYSSAPAKFEEIAIIEASSKASMAATDQGKMDVVVARLKEEAAKLGANGVLLQTTGSESTGGVMSGMGMPGRPAFGFGAYAAAMHKTGQARAIYVRD